MSKILFAVKRRIGFVRFCVLSLSLVAVSGCGSSYRPPSIVSGSRKVWVRPKAVTATVTATHTGVIGRSVEGRDIACGVYGDGHDVVLIIATIHGDENAGTPIVVRLKRELEQ
ncbi:MAG: murein peptide amidase A, partial [Planctomycetes bacterium]|nr:murein peptide amidase A [Planctomycetota bacterium]